ncbi:hypothetical protein [Rufibacter radiotolerans]|uniref:hypothetical protein n=1 Tax=Rufibacter radiotolerans TaxID=1379910 RepID=UPI000B2DFB16|nr:hypothetical protein [Rufibacter radiotolerans]
MSLYFGWIFIVTVANVSAALVSLGWDGSPLSVPVWSRVMIPVATLMVVFVVFSRSNPLVGLVGIWALYGIILKHHELDLEKSPLIITADWTSLAVLALAEVMIF